MIIKRITIDICQACLDGKGEECHTPGCALFLHAVDLPFPKGLYEVLAEHDDGEFIAAMGRDDPGAGVNAEGR